MEFRSDLRIALLVVLKIFSSDPVGVCLTGCQVRVRYLSVCHSTAAAAAPPPLAGTHTAGSAAAAAAGDDTEPLDLLQDVEISITPLGTRLAP